MTSVPTTLLCVTHGLWARVDLDGEGRRTHAQILRATLDDPAAALRQLLALGPPVRADCGLLLEGLYLRTVDVETRASELLPEREVARWLALRSEARSGVPAERAKVACTRHGVGFGERHRAWLSIADRLVVDPLAWTLEDAGAKRFWIASPAGLLGEYDEPVIEVWSGATWCGGASTACAISGEPAGSKRWRRRIASWLTTVPHVRVRFHGRQSDASLLADARLHPSGDVVAPDALLDRLERVARAPRADLARLQWSFEREPAHRVAETPATETPLVAPVAAPAPEPFSSASIAVAPPAPPSPAPFPAPPQPFPAPPQPTTAPPQPTTAAPLRRSHVLEAAAASILLCLAVIWLQNKRHAPTQEVVAAEPALAARVLQANLDLERGRQSALLAALWEEINDDVNLSGTHAEDAATIVTGVALDSSRVDAYAQALAKRLAPSGWRVRPAVGKRVELDAGAAVWQFALPIEPVGQELRR